MLSKTFMFIVGTLVGAFISQNYNVPNIKHIVNQSYHAAQVVEKQFRKGKDKKDEQEENK